jgi:DeoR/GlpR family transcriptional regulator of sugar metabolism
MMGRPKILTPEAIAEIKAIAELRRTLSDKMLGRRFGVSPSTIRNTIHDETYQRKLRRKRKATEARARAH